MFAFTVRIGYRRERATSQATQCEGGFVMPVPPVGENAVMLCDWRGRCTWASTGNLPVTIGKFVWENLSAASQEDAKVAIGRVVALRETRQIEVADQQGNRFRGWLWPLDSPDVAVCILAVRIPRNLAKLTERERECLELLATGTETKLIAKQLDVSLSTVHTHMKRAREKLGLGSVEALISFAARYFYPLDKPLDAGQRASDSKRFST